MTDAGSATYPMKIAALIVQAAERHAPILCAECKEPLLPGQKIAFDHRQAKGRGGANAVRNLRAVHDEADPPFNCHDRKTNGGKARATTRGSDIYEIRKTDRLEQANGETIDEPRARRWGSRPFPKSQRKLQSRPFPSRKTEPAT